MVIRILKFQATMQKGKQKNAINVNHIQNTIFYVVHAPIQYA